MTLNVEPLAQMAIDAKETLSHCPYSEMEVGAAMTHQDRTLRAANVELKPTSIGLHAEQRAVAKALSIGDWDGFDAIVIALESSQPPCGVCLQALASLEPTLDADVYVKNTLTDELDEYTLEELLPEAYTSR
jgi:cytidine deaminase